MKTTTNCLLTLLIPFSLAVSQPGPPRALHAHREMFSEDIYLTWLPPAAPGDIYSTNFDDGDLTGWEFSLPSAWTVENGRLTVTLHTIDQESAALYTGQEFFEYVYEFDAMYHQDNVADINDQITALYTTDNFGNDDTNQARLYLDDDYIRIETGTTSFHGDAGFLHDQVDVPIRFTILVEPPKYRVYLNGRYVVEYPYYGLYVGNVGFKGMWHQPPASISYDNIKVATIGAGVDHYNVYRNSVLIESTPNLEITETYNGIGAATYTVTAVGQNGESHPSEPVITRNYDALLYETFSSQATPTGWEVIAEVPTNTWRFEGGRAHFSTRTYNSESYADLISPPFSLGNAAAAWLTFDRSFYHHEPGWHEPSTSVSIQLVEGGVWFTIDSTTATHTWQQIDLDLTPYAGEDEVRVKFRAEGGGQDGGEAEVDNVLVQSHPPRPYGLTLTPQNDVIPEEGGTLTYSARVFNDLGVAYPGLTYWTTVLGPQGVVHRPVEGFNFYAPGIFDVTVDGLSQDVPSFAPAGQYVFFGKIGVRPDYVYTADIFTFIKEGDTTATAIEEGLDSTAWKEDISQLKYILQNLAAGSTTSNDSGLLEKFSLAPVYPNPFNERATVRVDLPDNTELQVVVYDINGRKVMELARGSYAAGAHTYTLDGSKLASGLYFVRAMAGDGKVQTQKFVLLK